MTCGYAFFATLKCRLNGAGQVGASYNSRTGVAAAGRRGAVHNVYTGNYIDADGQHRGQT
ncbi:hypothetical protein [Pseudomonas sp. NFX98]|uniref:hypothetical protein n=1 Tax=Pseudomonas sp. NFX98 TaxID=3399122 RepID=UPI0039FC0E9C